MIERLSFHERQSLTVARRGTGSIPFYMQHGLCGDHRQIDEIGLDHPSIRTITLNCRGHGWSDLGPEEELCLAAFEEDLAALMTYDHAEGAFLGGISMGAAISLRLACLMPERVRALILVRPAWGLERAPENLAAYRLLGGLMSILPVGERRDAFAATSAAKELELSAPANFATLLRLADTTDDGRTAALLTRIAASGMGIRQSSIAASRVPTLVIATEQDFAHPLAIAEDLAGLIPGASLERITPKAVDPARHLADMRRAIHAFIDKVLT